MRPISPAPILIAVLAVIAAAVILYAPNLSELNKSHLRNTVTIDAINGFDREMERRSMKY